MLQPGQILEGKYRIDRFLGRGGMGAIYVGEHTRIRRVVVIKVLHPDKRDRESAMRFEREAEAAGRIKSDHIVEVLDFGATAEGDRFMVMEHLEGETFKERLKSRGRLPPGDVVTFGLQLLTGLAAAHAAGIIHRDLKPDNVFIVKDKAGRADFVKILDFGISKFDVFKNEDGMTVTGAVMGTPFYMSPEQARATKEVDFRSDLYSAGVLLYEATTGKVPFHADALTDLMFKICFEDAPHPNTHVPGLDDEFSSILLKSITRDPEGRYQTAAEMMAALEQWASPAAAGPGKTSKMVPAQMPAPAPRLAGGPPSVPGATKGTVVMPPNMPTGPPRGPAPVLMTPPAPPPPPASAPVSVRGTPDTGGPRSAPEPMVAPTVPMGPDPPRRAAHAILPPTGKLPDAVRLAPTDKRTDPSPLAPTLPMPPEVKSGTRHTGLYVVLALAVVVVIGLLVLSRMSG